jgi:hypothetical protein
MTQWQFILQYAQRYDLVSSQFYVYLHMINSLNELNLSIACYTHEKELKSDSLTFFCKQKSMERLIKISSLLSPAFITHNNNNIVFILQINQQPHTYYFVASSSCIFIFSSTVYHHTSILPPLVSKFQWSSTSIQFQHFFILLLFCLKRRLFSF